MKSTRQHAYFHFCKPAYRIIGDILLQVILKSDYADFIGSIEVRPTAAPPSFTFPTRGCTHGSPIALPPPHSQFLTNTCRHLFRTWSRRTTDCWCTLILSLLSLILSLSISSSCTPLQHTNSTPLAPSHRQRACVCTIARTRSTHLKALPPPLPSPFPPPSLP